MRVWVIVAGRASDGGGAVRDVVNDAGRGAAVRGAMDHLEYCYGGSGEWEREERVTWGEGRKVWRAAGLSVEAIPYEIEP